MRRFSLLVLAFSTALLTGCGGGGTAGPPPPPQPQVTVTLSPPTGSVRAGDTQRFNATVTGTLNPAVTWSVNDIAGGNATVGTIDSTGLYAAPAAVPNPSNVVVKATSVAAPAASGSAAVSLLNPIPALTAVNPTVAGVGTFTLTVTGSKFVNGSQISFGGGPLATTFVSDTRLSAMATASAGQVGSVAVQVTNPNPGSASSSPVGLQVVSGNVISARAAVRFLEQSTFGPTPELINQVRQVGFVNFLNDQFNAPASTFDDPAAGDNSPAPLQARFVTNALRNPDQLRQRTAFALHKIWVVSWIVVNRPDAFAPYLRMHMNHAFTDYRTIMENVTLNPAMGAYQDVANNDKPNPLLGTSANENYGRELMQLFTIGVWKLSQDGTLLLDAQGQPIPTYDQAVVEGNARALTGWTYPTQPGRTLRWPNPPFFVGQLVPVQSHHDMDAGKLLLDGFVLPAGQTAEQDLKDTLDNLFNHPNVPPHVSKLLIQQLVTSNPSPAYVKRVADAFVAGTFSGFGSGRRGDIKAVLAAVLLDPEARRGDDPATADAVDGHLREPVLLILGLLRAFNATSDGSPRLINEGRNMGQWLLYPPTVFSYFSVEEQIPGTTLLGPEFGIQTTATTLVRANFVNSFAFGSLGSGTTVNFAPFANLAANPDQLLDALDTLLLHNSMSPEMRASLTTAINAVPAGANQNLQRARTAIYVIASSSQYQVQH